MKFIGNLSSVNGEEPFVACVVGSKRVGGEGGGGGEGQKRQSLLPSLYRDPPPLFPSSPSFVLKKKLFTKSAGSVFDWFCPFYHLSLVSLFPKRGRTKTAGDSSSSKNTLLRVIMPDEENIENLHCINKNTGIPISVWKKRSQRDRFTREILHKKKTTKS